MLFCQFAVICGFSGSDAAGGSTQVSRIDDLAELIGGISDKIDEAMSASGESAQEAEQVGATAAALGAEGLVEGLTEVKTQLDALSDNLKSASERASELRALTLSIGENG